MGTLEKAISPEHKIQINSIKTWHLFMDVSCDIIRMELNDGENINLVDRYSTLLKILEEEAVDKELPWER